MPVRVAVDDEIGEWESAVYETGDIWQEVFQEYSPRIIPTGLAWAKEKIINEFGRPYDHLAYPHLGAPGGPWDAWDNPTVRTISLMFGTRLGKTFFGLCCCLFMADNWPAPGMHANATEQLCTQVMERGYEMIRRRSSLRALMASHHETDWRQTEFRFKGCKVFGAWARSVSTLADKDVLFGHAAEIDKWEHASTSKEADPLALFTDRFKNYQSIRKQIFESTPTVRGNSRIEDKIQAGSDCRLWVPCPKCWQHQTLEVGDENSAHGLKFDRAATGRSDPAVAFATARYVCRHCQAELHDFNRAWMIRRGVWVPRGCDVDSEAAIEAAESRMKIVIEDRPKWRGWKESPWITGTPARDGVDQSYQLSSLYALSLSWGDIASEFVKCHDKPQLLRNFVNQWKAETWEPRRSRSTPERVAERLGTPRGFGIVPKWGRFLTVSVDRQRADGGFVVCVVLAHGEEDRAAVIAHAEFKTMEDVYQNVIRHAYIHEDGGPQMIPVISVFDSGWDTKATYDFVNDHEGCFACKGSDGDLGGEPYRLAELGKRTRTDADGQLLLSVGTDFWEHDLQHRIDDLLADEPGSLSLSKDAAGDWDFIAQLLNATLTDKQDSRGNDRLLWIKKREHEPNDYRDAVRYGLCAARAWLDERDGAMPVRVEGVGGPRRPRVATETRPDGRPWI